MTPDTCYFGGTMFLVLGGDGLAVDACLNNTIVTCGLLMDPREPPDDGAGQPVGTQLWAGPAYLYYRLLVGARSTARRVNITCPLQDWLGLLAARGGAGSSGGVPLAPCGTATVTTGLALVEALQQLQPGHARVLVTLDAHMALPVQPTPQRDGVTPDDATPLLRITRNITLAGGLILASPPAAQASTPAAGVVAQLDLRHHRNTFELTPGDGAEQPASGLRLASNGSSRSILLPSVYFFDTKSAKLTKAAAAAAAAAAAQQSSLKQQQQQQPSPAAAAQPSPAQRQPPSPAAAAAAPVACSGRGPLTGPCSRCHTTQSTTHWYNGPNGAVICRNCYQVWLAAGHPDKLHPPRKDLQGPCGRCGSDETVQWYNSKDGSGETWCTICYMKYIFPHQKVGTGKGSNTRLPETVQQIKDTFCQKSLQANLSPHQPGCLSKLKNKDAAEYVRLLMGRPAIEDVVREAIESLTALGDQALQGSTPEVKIMNWWQNLHKGAAAAAAAESAAAEPAAEPAAAEPPLQQTPTPTRQKRAAATKAEERLKQQKKN
ncbi:hypothetical protein TSOC_010659 [Tetrabaena socialis]|uniref:GATA-type domain-containing protein n=1 Tax=Tetrabaena socialis TaxID=47790 RepID=A0A2J7ZSS1_9CHLO|nr:hypothetical protein TSOC_010659 [Tetrabaena socialis]|eukprot:PNH03290.1 hypothetical protein TSOC_010659 [Tetrabaena socialis]